jgi:glycosyltransferase involved in cell wall biosynthesis
MNKTLSIVIPVYYNEDSIEPLYQKLIKVERQLKAIKINLQLIFVDDGSGDFSFQKLLKIKRQRRSIKLIKLTRNFGAVHASKCGLGFVTGDCFTILAADLQDPPELILQMVKKWISGSTFIICERSSREDPFVSKLFAKFFYWLVRNLVINDYPRGGYDMALMDKSILKHIVFSSKNLYTPLLVYWLGYKPDVIHYHRAKRQYGKSRWTFLKKINAFLDIMVGFSVRPIRLISAFGAVISVMSFIYGTSIVISALFNKISIPGFATIVSLISFMLGLIIIMLGIIGEYLWRIFDETNKRPEVVIEKIY